MHTTRTLKKALKKTLAGAVLSGGVAVAGLGLASGTAQSEPAPQFNGPFPADNFTVPHQWCPGKSLPMPDVRWDMSVCHQWYWVPVGGMGNVGQFVWEETLHGSRWVRPRATEPPYVCPGYSSPLTPPAQAAP